MDWNSWKGKGIFIRTKSGKVYSGEVIDVDSKDPIIIFITINDKFGLKVTFATSEIVEIKEENKK